MFPEFSHALSSKEHGLPVHMYVYPLYLESSSIPRYFKLSTRISRLVARAPGAYAAQISKRKKQRPVTQKPCAIVE